MTEMAVGKISHKIHGVWEHKLYKNILHIQQKKFLVGRFCVMQIVCQQADVWSNENTLDTCVL